MIMINMNEKKRRLSISIVAVRLMLLVVLFYVFCERQRIVTQRRGNNTVKATFAANRGNLCSYTRHHCVVIKLFRFSIVRYGSSSCIVPLAHRWHHGHGHFIWKQMCVKFSRHATWNKINGHNLINMDFFRVINKYLIIYRNISNPPCKRMQSRTSYILYQ